MSGFGLVASPAAVAPPKKSGKYKSKHAPELLETGRRETMLVPMFTISGCDGERSKVTAFEWRTSLLLKHGPAGDENAAKRQLKAELSRCSAAKRIRDKLTAAMKDTFEGTNLNVGKAVTGLYPAFVFETLSAREAQQGNAPSEVELHLDSVLPCGEILPDGVSRSIHKRVTTLFHDHKRHTCGPEALAQGAMDLARKATMIASEERKALAALLAEETVQDDALTINVTKKEHIIQLQCQAHTHALLPSHFEKLRKLYSITCAPSPDTNCDSTFHMRLFTLLHRYFGLTGAAEDPASEGGWHGAVPFACFESLRATCDLTVEMFASPFNCVTSDYCSAFVDTDVFFGSLGSCFALQPLQGTFEANPPFDHSVAVQMGKHFSTTLQTAHAASSFLTYIVVVPCADKGKELPSMQEAFKALRSDGFVSGEATLSAKEVSYVDGNQQCAKDTRFTARLDTRVLVLQTAAAKAQFPPERVLDELSCTWKQDLTVDADGNGLKRKREEGEDGEKDDAAPQPSLTKAA